MKKEPIYHFYAFGFNYGLILKDGLIEWEREEAIDVIKGFLSKLSELDLSVTDIAAEKLKEITQELEKNDDKIMSELESKCIKTEMKKIDAVLDAELKLKQAYVLTERRYSTKKLLDNPRSLLSSKIAEKLSEDANLDFSLGCKLIAFGQPTGASFHFMRFLERLVKELYFTYKKTNRLEKPMWKSMIQQLRDKRSPKPTSKVLDHLDGIRAHFRNPTQHPDLFYSIDEAQDLLNQTIVAANMIIAEILKKA